MPKLSARTVAVAVAPANTSRRNVATATATTAKPSRSETVALHNFAALSAMLDQLCDNAATAAANDRRMAAETRNLQHVPSKVLTAMRQAENQAPRYSAERYSVEFADGDVSVSISRTGRQFVTLTDGTKAALTPDGMLAERVRKAKARKAKAAARAGLVAKAADALVGE
jgi:hypothetical protein